MALGNCEDRATEHFDGGVNWTAVKALVPATLVGVAITFTPALQGMANFAWFTGCFLGGLFFLLLARREQVRVRAPLDWLRDPVKTRRNFRQRFRVVPRKMAA